MNKAKLFDLVRVLHAGKLPKGYHFTMGDTFMKLLHNYPATLFQHRYSKKKLPRIEGKHGYIVNPEGLAILKYGPTRLKQQLMSLDPHKMVTMQLQNDCYSWFMKYFELKHGQWLFICGGSWGEYDDTMEGAADRILYMIKKYDTIKHKIDVGSWRSFLKNNAKTIVKEYTGLYDRIKAKQKSN